MTVSSIKSVSLIKTSRWRRPQEGSAYLLTAMVLVVLGAIGLALAYATQVEMILGTNERLQKRSFYAAESAAHLAVARTLYLRDKRSYGLRVREPGPGRTDLLLETAPVVPIRTQPCRYCSINNASQLSSQAFLDVTHRITVRGSLVGRDNPEIVVARKAVTEWIALQPWQDALPPPPEEAPVLDPEDLED